MVTSLQFKKLHAANFCNIQVIKKGAKTMKGKAVDIVEI